jgi:hypothetical protein
MNPWQLPAASDHFSEFTYGFALVNELVSANPRIVNVPVFPSLIMEGQTGGGYDVYLDKPGRPMFLQFKLARYIKGHRAKEFQERKFRKPFYRMSIRSKEASQQHELLLALEQQTKAAVYYCAPAFHTLGQLNTLYNTQRVERQSRFVRPSELPPIQDNDKHWLSFQRARGGTTAFYSEEGKHLELDDRPIQERLAADLEWAKEVPLGETINTLVRWLEEKARHEQGDWKELIATDPETYRELQSALDHARDLTPIEKITMLSNSVLNSTFCVLQARPPQ